MRTMGTVEKAAVLAAVVLALLSASLACEAKEVEVVLQPDATGVRVQSAGCEVADGDYDVVTRRAAMVSGLEARIRALEGRRATVNKLYFRAVRSDDSRQQVLRIKAQLRAMDKEIKNLRSQPLGGLENQRTFVRWANEWGFTTRGYVDTAVDDLQILILGLMIIFGTTSIVVVRNLSRD